MLFVFERDVPYMEPSAISAQSLFGFPPSEFVSLVPFDGMTILAAQRIHEDKFLVHVPGYADNKFMERVRRQNEYMKIRESADIIPNNLACENKLYCEMERMSKEMESGIESMETDLTRVIPEKIPYFFVEEYERQKVADYLCDWGFRGFFHFNHPRYLSCKVE